MLQYLVDFRMLLCYNCEYKAEKYQLAKSEFGGTFNEFMLVIIGINNLSIAVLYSFVTLSTMLLVGKVKLLIINKCDVN